MFFLRQRRQISAPGPVLLRGPTIPWSQKSTKTGNFSPAEKQGEGKHLIVIFKKFPTGLFSDTTTLHNEIECFITVTEHWPEGPPK